MATIANAQIYFGLAPERRLSPQAAWEVSHRDSNGVVHNPVTVKKVRSTFQLTNLSFTAISSTTRGVFSALRGWDRFANSKVSKYMSKAPSWLKACTAPIWILISLLSLGMAIAEFATSNRKLENVKKLGAETASAVIVMALGTCQMLLFLSLFKTIAASAFMVAVMPYVPYVFLATLVVIYGGWFKESLTRVCDQNELLNELKDTTHTDSHKLHLIKHSLAANHAKDVLTTRMLRNVHGQDPKGRLTEDDLKKARTDHNQLIEAIEKNADLVKAYLTEFEQDLRQDFYKSKLTLGACIVGVLALILSVLNQIAAIMGKIAQHFLQTSEVVENCAWLVSGLVELSHNIATRHRGEL